MNPTPLQIRTARGALGWSRRQAAERFRVSEWTWWALEQPESSRDHQTPDDALAQDIEHWLEDTAETVVSILKGENR